MPFGSLTTIASFDKRTYTVVFDTNNMYVNYKSNGMTHSTYDLSNGVEIHISSGNFNVVTINDLTGNFTHDIDISLANAKILYNESANKIIGTGDFTDTNVVKHNYIIGQSNTPIRIKKINSTTVRFTCPCDTEACNTNPKNSGYSETY